MANDDCLCGNGFGQLGLMNCSTVAGLPVRDIFVPTYDSDNVRNGIPVSELVLQTDGTYKLPESFIIGKLDEPDPTKRWNITPKLMDNINPSSTDDTDYTTSLGEIYNIRNGVQATSYELPSVPYGIASRINNNCVETSKYTVTEKKQIIGEVSDDRLTIYPLKIQKGSIKSKNNEATVDKPFFVSVSYQLSRLADESKFIIIGADEIVPDMTEALSSISAVITQSTDNANTATELYVKITSDFEGNGKGLRGITGVDVIADWTVEDAGVSVAISAVEELAGEIGNYKLTITSTPATDLDVSYSTTRALTTDYGFIAPAVTITSGS